MSGTDDPDASPSEATPPTARGKPRHESPLVSDVEDMGDLPVGSTLGKYRIIRPLGAGGMGAVYEAEHVEIGKPVALKVLSGTLAASARARARFLREAASASKIRDRHVVNVTDFGAHDGAVPFLVMELLHGQDLSQLLNRYPRGLPAQEIADIMLAVCAGVYAAHQAGVVHRDLKPSNIFLARTSRREVEPKVLDFGISKADDGPEAASLTDAGAVLGTPHYLSPEQASGAEVDAQTDQYALGVVLYECSTGQRPHEGHTSYVILRSIDEGKFLPPSRVRRDLPPSFEAVILRAMGRNPAARFPSVHALGTALLPFASEMKRLFWADYYGRDPLEASIPESTPVPIAGIPSLVPALMMPGPAPALPPTRRLPPTWPPRSEPRTATPGPVSEATSPHEARRGWLAGAVVLASIAVTAVLMAVRTNQEPREAVEHSPAIRAVTERLAPPAPEPEPAPAPVAAPTVASTAEIATGEADTVEVYVAVVDPPPGLRAVVDRRRTAVPFRLKLKRGSAGSSVTFHAPGYEPRELVVGPNGDRPLELNMRRRVREPSPPAKGTERVRLAPKAAKTREAPPASSPPELQPILDI